MKWRTKRILWFVGSFTVILLIVGLFIFADSFSGKNSYEEFFKKYYRVLALSIPEKIDFCGEAVPLSRVDVRESMDRELLVNTYGQSPTLLMIKRASRWFPVIIPILKKNNIPEDFKYLAVIESAFTHNVSTSGASGFWQFLNKTAIEYHMEVNDEIDERYNVEKATEAACLYFKKSYAVFQNWTLVAASYNMGISGIQKQIETQKVNSYYNLYLNQETGRYVFRILALKLIMKQPREYGFYIRKKDLYFSVPTIKVSVDTSITDLVRFASLYNANLKTLKLFNPWLKKNTLTNKNKKTYYLEFPKEGYMNLDTLTKELSDPNGIISNDEFAADTLIYR